MCSVIVQCARKATLIENGATARSPIAGRLRIIVGLCSLAVALALAAGATPAGAVVAKIGGHGYGITPLNGADEAKLVAAYEAQHAAAHSAGPLAHRYDVGPSGGTQLTNVVGGPVMHSVTTHVIYWDPNKEFTSTSKDIVDGFFGDVAHDSGLPTNVFAVAGQYTDATGHAAYSSTATTPRTDGEKYPTGKCTAPVGGDPGPPYTECMVDEQLQEELTRFIKAEELPVGPTQLYFLLLPHKVATCFEEEAEVAPGVFAQICSNNFFCAYHGYIEPGTASEIIYADIPFSLLDSTFAKGCQDDGHEANLQQPNPDNAGGEDSETRFADVALKYMSHEAIEAITDPLVNFDTAWVDEEGLEIGDKCNGVTADKEKDGVGYDASSFLPVLGGSVGGDNLFNQSINGGSYYLQSEWDDAAQACLMSPLPLSGAAFSPSSAIAGAPVIFNGSAIDPYGAFEPTWIFGDGGSGSGTSPSHTYPAPGEYTVTMTPKDGLTDSTASTVSHTITVASPPAPPPVPTTTAKAAAVPDGSFPNPHAVFHSRTGAITFTTSVLDPGTLSWLATFQNGKFGAFASASKCKTGFVRLGGKCRPAKIVFARASKLVGTPGSLSVTLKPSASALKALKNALKRRKGLPVTVVFLFKSSLGGSPVSHSQSLAVKLKG